MRDTAKITTISGLILIPWVSSSKKRSSPALAAGIGELLSRRFSLRLNVHRFLDSCVLVMLDLINVVSSEDRQAGAG
jgi:hypothetical protein